MRNIRSALIAKIEKDTGFEINDNWRFQRHTLTWAHRSVGRMKWYWYYEGKCIGSAENMKDLLKCSKIEISEDSSYVEFSSSYL